MSESFYRYLAKLYEPAYISQGVNYDGTDINTFQKKSGSRMQLAVSIQSISGGATLTVTLDNAATLENPVYATVFNKSYMAAGIDTNIILDLNRYCVLTVNVSGGVATYSIVVTLVDNASSGDFATDTTLQEIEQKPIQLFTKAYDAIVVSYPTATQEIYMTKIGGTGGVVQQTATINYTDGTKSFVADVSRVG